jgi:iron complex outermembrane receptor protein
VGTNEGAQEDLPPSDTPLEIAETVTVTGARLRARDETEELTAPAHVTVLLRDDIQRGGAATLQDLLATQAGVVLFDQVGDDVSKTLDLRGFGGRGTRVFLNGAPLNDPRNNGLALELVPLEQLERIEITRGSTAALAGGGAEAGVINLYTRHGGGHEGSISVAVGELGSRDLGGSLAHRVGSTDLALSGSNFETDGFRENAGGDLGRLGLDLGWELGTGRRLDLSIVRGVADFGNPGAATAAELARDRDRSFFNALDFTNEDLNQAALNLTAALNESWSLSANLYARDRGTEALTTGRAAPLFGGFFLEADTEVLGSTIQLGFGRPTAGAGNELTGGFEFLDGETGARGFGTPPTDLASVSPAGLTSDNVTDRRTAALYLQDRWQLSPRITATASARYDRDQVGYREGFPDPANAATREFSELSLRAGLAARVGAGQALYASLGEAFLPPTVEELFAFPRFGSNPTLRPEASTSAELGFRGRWRGGLALDLAIFQIDSEDEIVFDPDSPLGLFGANVNAGEARRRGLELSARGEIGDRWRTFVNLTLMEPEFTNGANRGKTLPLVPEQRLAAGFDIELPLALELRAVAHYVGAQVLDNDDANAAARLDSYTLVHTRLSWAVGDARRYELFVDARNLFDERYATRGIYAFDFQTFVDSSFFSPAPGRRLMGGVEWRF